VSNNNYKNIILFENLVNRLSLSEETGQYILPGVITSDERTALISAQRLLGQSQVTVDTGSSSLGLDQEAAQLQPVEKGKVSTDAEVVTGAEAIVEPPPVSPRIQPIPVSVPSAKIIEKLTSKGIEGLLDLTVIHPEIFQPDLKLGLDFGTAYSKACMVKVENGEEIILDLPLGIYAGEDALEMPVHSSLFIDPDGRLYFGPIAVEKSLEARSAGNTVSRIDSIKSFLIDENRVTIDDSPLPKIYNPTDIDVSKAALLTFYLGYLLHLVREAALERHNVDISEVKQRISLPCYEPNHRIKVIKEISKLFTLGEVLGKSFRDEWENGFRIEDVMYLYEWMRKNINKNSPFIERFLEEPLAVAGSRLSIDGHSLGNVCMVVDVGAGTTDFTMFEIFADAKRDNTIATEVKNSEYGVPIAGDKLDTILLAYILTVAGVSRSNENYKEVLVSLRLDIRDYKERLFSANNLTYVLAGGVTGQIKLSDFLQDKAVKVFSQDLHNAFVHVLSSIHQSWIKTKIQQKNMKSKLPVILTGGGADLPMVKKLAKGVIDVRGYQVQLHLSPSVPKWLSDNYEGEIIDLYPQMSVSLGSAKQFVIEKTGVKEEYA
jgi:hypothetical protein